MKRSLLYIAFLLFAAKGLCADYYGWYRPELMKVQPQREGPWEYYDVRCGIASEWMNWQFFDKVCFYSLNNRTYCPTNRGMFKKDYPSIYQWNDGDGLGFTCRQTCNPNYFVIVFSTYRHTELIPPYTRIRLRWDYSVAGKSNYFRQNVGLYAFEGSDVDLKNIKFDIMTDASSRAGAQYLLSNVVSDVGQTKRVDGKATIDFNNLQGGETISKTWRLMLTHSYFTTSGEGDVHQWGAFRSEAVAWDTTYYKIVSFDANGGSGYMKEMSFEDRDVVPANTFVRDGYTFQGWATLPNGIIRYNPGGEITATLDSKGPVTLYAIWKAQPTTVIALINAIGEVVYTDECKANIDAAREAYNALSGEEKAQVTNYSTLTDAETLYNAVDAVVTAINAIGAVQYSDESRTLIDEAQAAYDALTDEQKALVVNYNVLSAAQDMYDVLRVIDKIDAIGAVTYTSECKALIDDARAAYDALLTLAQKSQVTNYATLLAAEAAYAAFGKKTVLFMEQDGTTPVGDSQLKSIDYPALPAGASEWQSVEKDVTDKTIVIKAVE